MQDHDCLEYLEFREAYQCETHGLDCGPYERWWDQWWECAVCGETYTDKDLESMQGTEP
jgi:hypothetical protein